MLVKRANLPQGRRAEDDIQARAKRSAISWSSPDVWLLLAMSLDPGHVQVDARWRFEMGEWTRLVGATPVIYSG